MQARAIFRRKEVCFEPSECEIEKVIHLSDSDFARFQQTLLDNYDFLHDNADLMRVENGVTHCLLVVGETLDDGILVNSEGSDYARYAAYFPNAKSFLLTQGQTQQVVQAEAPAEAASPSAVGGVSAALLAYGEKMNGIHEDEGISINARMSFRYFALKGSCPNTPSRSDKPEQSWVIAPTYCVICVYSLDPAGIL